MSNNKYQKTKSAHTRDPERPYSSWDPMTPAKFIFEINKQAGTPISMQEAYRTAELGVRGSASEDHSSVE